MYDKIILSLLVLLAIPSVYASDQCVTGETCFLQSSIVKNNEFVFGENANISIFFPNGTELFHEMAMYEVKTGIFWYNFTPEISGNWYYYINFTDPAGNPDFLEDNSFEVREESFMSAAGPSLILVLGILGYIAILLYVTLIYLNDRHYILKLGTMLYVLFLVLLIPKAGYDAAMGIDGNTAVTFIMAVTWYIRAIMLYIIGYTVWSLAGGLEKVKYVYERMRR